MKYILFALTMALSSSLWAQARLDMGVLAGYRLNDGSSRQDNFSVDGSGGLQVGGLAFLPLNDNFVFRTGFIYAQRNFEVKNDSNGNTEDHEFAHFDVPLTFMYKISDFGGIFVGPGVSLKVKDDCSGDCDGVKSTMIPISFGGHFKIAPQVAAEFYYETAPSKLDNAIEDPSAVVLNAVITFE